MNSADVIITGAGVIGLSIAYNLAVKKKGLKITVIEQEKLPGMGSTAQCTGGIRHQFTSKLNVNLTKLSMPYFRKFNSQMDTPIFLRQRGYLFCTGQDKRLAEFKNMLKTTKELGIPTQFFTREQLQQRYPFLNTEDIKGATYCPVDAYADPGNVVQGYYKQAARQGVEVRLGEAVEEILVRGGRMAGVKTDKGELSAPVVVNAAGPGFNRLASLAGLEVPSRPFRRQVYVCASMENIPRQSPLVVDSDTGFYMHVEKNGTLLLGGTDKDTAPGTSTAVDWSCLDNFIEAAVNRIPTLDQAELMRAYVGIRSLTPDYHGIVGESKGLPGFFLAGGFGGQGFMHAPAVGLIAAQLIVDGKCELVDTSKLSPDRFETNSLNTEGAVF